MGKKGCHIVVTLEKKLEIISELKKESHNGQSPLNMIFSSPLLLIYRR